MINDGLIIHVFN